VKGEDDDLATVSPLLEIVGNWREFLGREVGQREYELVRSHERTGRPLGSEGFIESLEKKLERVLRRQKPGPKPKPKGETSRGN
jgi:putative transposase